jgi:hypothetical protein
LIGRASARTTWTKEPEAKPAATRPNMALRLVSSSPDTCCWALTASPGRATATRVVFLGTFNNLFEPLSWRLPSRTAWDVPRRPAIDAIACAMYEFSFNNLCAQVGGSLNIYFFGGDWIFLFNYVWYLWFRLVLELAYLICQIFYLDKLDIVLTNHCCTCVTRFLVIWHVGLVSPLD